MRKCCRNPMIHDREVLDTVELVAKLVSHKIKNINVALPVLVAAVTPILAYFFTAQFELDAKIVVAVITIYVLLVWAIILWAHVPIVSRRKKKTVKKYTKGEFTPCNLTHSAYLSDEDYLKAYETYFNRELLSKEKITIMSLKNKINEMRFRTNCLAVVFGMLILGVVVVAIALLWFVFKGVG